MSAVKKVSCVLGLVFLVYSGIAFSQNFKNVKAAPIISGTSLKSNNKNQQVSYQPTKQ